MGYGHTIPKVNGLSFFRIYAGFIFVFACLMNKSCMVFDPVLWGTSSFYCPTQLKTRGHQGAFGPSVNVPGSFPRGGGPCSHGPVFAVKTRPPGHRGSPGDSMQQGAKFEGASLMGLEMVSCFSVQPGL